MKLALYAPFRRAEGTEAGDKHIVAMKAHWLKFGSRLEAVLAANGGAYMVGQDITYADILVVHCLTWYVEECGPEIVSAMPLLVELQYKIMNLSGIQEFIKNDKLYYPIGDAKYVQQINSVLGRKI